MNSNRSELWAGALILLLILVAAAILLPPMFRQHGAEWVEMYDWAVK
jgi:hypothetical protein